MNHKDTKGPYNFYNDSEERNIISGDGSRINDLQNKNPHVHSPPTSSYIDDNFHSNMSGKLAKIAKTNTTFTHPYSFNSVAVSSFEFKYFCINAFNSG